MDSQSVGLGGRVSEGRIMNIDREKLRIAIAEKMGYRNVRYDWVNGSDAIKDWMHEGGRGIPEYTADLNAAWQLVDWSISQNLRFSIRFTVDVFVAQFGCGMCIGISPSAPLAICLAFAKANGIEIPTTEGAK